MKYFFCANLYTIFISVISSHTVTHAINLTKSLFQHLDPDCHLIVAHHINFKRSDTLSPPIEANKGIYIYQLPQLDTYPSSDNNRNNGPRGIYTISQKSHFLSSAFCFIGVILTKKSDFDRKPEQLSEYVLSQLTGHQTDILYKIMYVKYPGIMYINENSNLHVSLLVRVQLDFNRVMYDSRIFTAVFIVVCNLIIVKGREEWYHITPIPPWYYKSTLLPAHEVFQAIRKHSRFQTLMSPPNVFYLRTKRNSFLNIHGYYSRKECCEAYGKNRSI